MGKHDEIIALKNAYKDKLACEPNEAWEIVIEALEKQIPKKVVYGSDVYDENSNPINGFWMCPECDFDLSRFEGYCPVCGQKLDWSEEDDK